MSFGSGIIVTLVVKFGIVPWQRQKIQQEVMYSSANNSEDDRCQLTLATYSGKWFDKPTWYDEDPQHNYTF
jgi:hypothetical protein